MKQALTDTLVRSLKAPAKGRLEITDTRCGGLVLRVTPNAIKSWSFRFRARATGRLGRVTLGEYPDLGLAAARARADGLRQDVAAGLNPAERKRRERADAASTSFEHLAQRYLTEYAQRKKRSHRADERNLQKHVLPRWKSRSYASIKRADVIELTERLVSDGKPTLANRVQSLISGVFSFALDSSLVEANPCHRLRKRGVENVGRRVLSDDEIRLFWQGIVKPEAARPVGLGLRLALLTGARVGEIAGLCRAELEHVTDAARAVWVIPGQRTKNGRGHLIPLSSLARDTVLELLERISPSEQFLFPTRSRRRKGPMRGNTITQAMTYFAARLGSEPTARSWKAEPPTPHDLRRTLGTRLAELRVPKEVRDRVLNHISNDVGSRHYNLHDFADEKREALDRWTVALSAIVADASNLVSLPSAGGRVR